MKKMSWYTSGPVAEFGEAEKISRTARCVTLKDEPATKPDNESKHPFSKKFLMNSALKELAIPNEYEIILPSSCVNCYII